MKNAGGIQLLFLLTIGLLSRVQCQTPITCSSGYYQAGQTATITCHYHGVISTDHNTGLYITRRGLQASQDSSGTEVLMCHFSGGSVSVCDPEDGYRFISFDKNNLTIQVPDVSADFQGRYSCGVVPADGRTVYPCLLIVQGKPEPMKPAPEIPERSEALHRQVETTQGLVIFILVLIILAVITGVVALLLLAYRNKWGPFRTAGKPPKKDAEKGENRDGGHTRPIVQETTNPIFNANVSGSPPAAEPEMEPLLTGDNDKAPDSAIRDDAAVKADRPLEPDRAIEAKPETEEERRDRENREKAVRAEDEISKEGDKLNELKQRLKGARGEEKRSIEKETKESEERLKRLKKDEAERKKREVKERKQREKAEKGKRK